MSYHGWATKEALDKGLKSENDEIRHLAKRTWTFLHQHCDHANDICSVGP